MKGCSSLREVRSMKLRLRSELPPESGALLAVPMLAQPYPKLRKNKICPPFHVF